MLSYLVLGHMATNKHKNKKEKIQKYYSTRHFGPDDLRAKLKFKRLMPWPTIVE